MAVASIARLVGGAPPVAPSGRVVGGEDHVDVGEVVQLLRAALAHRDHGEPGRRRRGRAARRRPPPARSAAWRRPASVSAWQTAGSAVVGSDGSTAGARSCAAMISSCDRYARRSAAIALPPVTVARAPVGAGAAAARPGRCPTASASTRRMRPRRRAAPRPAPPAAAAASPPATRRGGRTAPSTPPSSAISRPRNRRHRRSACDQLAPASARPRTSRVRPFTRQLRPAGPGDRGEHVLAARRRTGVGEQPDDRQVGADPVGVGQPVPGRGADRGPGHRRSPPRAAAAWREPRRRLRLRERRPRTGARTRATPRPSSRSASSSIGPSRPVDAAGPPCAPSPGRSAARSRGGTAAPRRAGPLPPRLVRVAHRGQQQHRARRQRC